MTLCRKILTLLLVAFAVLALYLYNRFATDVPVTYDDVEEHFKYGSTGGERVSGFPYWIWRVLPDVCAEHLPGKGYESLGMLFEPGKDLPIGVSKRHVTGMDRVFLNCSGCHVSTVRETPTATPRIITGMPANRLNLMGFQNFFFNCAADAKFTPEFIVPAIQAAGGDLDLLDRYLVYPVAIYLMRDRLFMLRQRFSFATTQPAWGPGRVDTFSFAKALFNFPFDRMPAREMLGTADFPSIWNQGPREGMQLHWDGNNTKVEERNKSAAFGTGTTPPTIDLAQIGRIEDWLVTKKPPPFPFPTDAGLAAKGAAVYKEYCADCHGVSGSDFSGKYVGQVTPIALIGTDRHRLDNYTYDLAVNQATLYAGYPWRFTHFRKTFGYANMPLDGLWLRAPYLHNGSVPTLRDLLEPGAKRPKTFYRGNDLYDAQKVGFVADVAQEGERKFFAFDVTVPGNGNAGHEGKRYGTELPAAEKSALLEYLKTF
jgi:hypothetical protein